MKANYLEQYIQNLCDLKIYLDTHFPDWMSDFEPFIITHRPFTISLFTIKIRNECRKKYLNLIDFKQEQNDSKVEYSKYILNPEFHISIHFSVEFFYYDSVAQKLFIYHNFDEYNVDKNIQSKFYNRISIYTKNKNIANELPDFVKDHLMLS